MSQNQAILTYLKRGRTIDPQVALRLFGSFRLAARIKDLREVGYQISREMVHGRNGNRFARYRLAA
ncbi:MAG TPA: helix-turn-helix domain-containing protein [Bryobacteraceae bacterium]|nr:helix-turn-helix domain-containing protein [Bryobacteraceae bacterium]